MDPVVRVLSEYVTQAEGPSDEVAHEVKRRVLDTLGCAVAAFDEAGPRAVRLFASRRSQDRGATVWGARLRTDVESAVLANGVALRYLDMNDSYFGLESNHPSDIIGGILTVGSTMGCSGRQVIDSVAVGYEVAVSLCDAFNLRSRGWDHVNVTGIAAACGLARLLDLTAEETGHAIALSVVPHAAMRQTRLGDLTMWKGCAAADAVRHAVYACDLAAAGVEGPLDAFVGGYGFVRQVLGGDISDKSKLDSLRRVAAPQQILRTHIKVWPFGYVAQSAVEAAAALKARHGVCQDLISSVRIDTFQAAADMMASPEKWRPATRETADHSLPYVVAEMLRYGEVNTDSFRPERFASEDTYRFLERVSVHVDPEFTERYPREFPARVTILCGSASDLVSEVSVSAGHADRPLSDEALILKYLGLAEPKLGRAMALDLKDTVLALDSVADASSIPPLLETPVSHVLQ